MGDDLIGAPNLAAMASMLTILALLRLGGLIEKIGVVVISLVFS